ncbi:MAG TPA: dienelactone hydrolase family protein [Streptomyces sp.]|uniref:dienelactone hydrolase family protein n=1 Tax=Streptomyces sp. TaxID=1931 RepID=UPI002C826C24|nr:dienelactone hydrolase family protein [Streptomyces sp.]HWU05849.1 dienelactone hydrolase family protein [Streptomyces sp.]
MTVFILVSGVFTGPHVWADVAARLTAAGAEVRAVSLSGLGGPRPPAGTGIDLETHIADVLAVIDSVGRTAGQEIVLVGHDYGIHPVVGAADRRAGTVARIVYLDSGLPQDGVPALASVADQGLREEVLRAAGGRGEGAGAELPPPARDAWQLWGSTAGVPDAALDRLTALASPQPLDTLLQPLRLTGAAATLPMAGILCSGNGASIAMVQARADFGEPTLRALVDPRVTFFELPTGHWPMLSSPAALAVTLLKAVAGEGRRLTPVDDAARVQPFLLEVPELPRERSGTIDLYVPPAARGPRPALVFVHGGPVPREARPTPRDWPVLTGYARYAAGHGVVGVTLDHRLHAVTDYEQAAADLADAVERVRADPRVDADRVALWFFSGSGPLTADWMGKTPPWLRCLAANYPVMAPLPNWGRLDSRFHPAEAVAHAGSLPIVLVRAGLEEASVAATVEGFLTAAHACGADIEVIDVPNGHHSFETADRTEESSEAVRRAMRTVLRRLTA